MKDERKGQAYRHKLTGFGGILVAVIVTSGAVTKGDDRASDQRGTDYDLSWRSVDGGGVMFNSVADVELSGTIGQPDAGVLANGGFELTGGFWHPRVPDGDCPGGVVTFLDPPDGVVDARQPHPVGSTIPLQGIDTLEVSAPAGADAACWSLCETSGRGAPNSVADVVDHGDGTYTVSLSRPITSGGVTTLTYTPDEGSAVTASLIAHPSNVNGDSAASPLDILKEIDCVNGINPEVNCPWGVYSCDADHSGACNSADILRVIDLLNGADTFEEWNGTDRPINDGSCP